MIGYSFCVPRAAASEKERESTQLSRLVMPEASHGEQMQRRGKE